MLKLLGCLMLIVTGSLCGTAGAAALRSHTVQLKNVCSMLLEISELIRYKRSTKEEIIGCLKLNDSYFALLSGKTSPLTESEASLLGELLSKLGTTDAEGQLAMLGHGISRFNEYAQNAAEEQRTKCRLYEVLGFMGGAFAAVMFI